MTAPVITGLGVIAPNGIGAEPVWRNTLAGTGAIERITRFDPSSYSVQLAGEITADMAARTPSRLVPQTDHMTRLALVAADEALADADAVPAEMPDFAAGIVTAASAGGFDFGQRELEALWSKGSSYVSAYQSFAWFYPVNTGQISIKHGIRGPGGALVADQSGGLDALAKARRHLRDGTALMLAGGVDGSLCPWGWVCAIGSGRLSTRTDARAAYVPFDREASGSLLGEGGALLVLEDETAAAERRAPRRYGRLLGHAATFDPKPGSGRPPAFRRAIEQALKQAALTPGDVDVVFADAAGDPELDRQEVVALAAVFGPRGVPVTAPKTMTGRLLAGAGPLDAAIALLALRDQVVPPTINVRDEAFDDELDLVRNRPREARLETALVLARGQGGYNSAVVLQRA